MASLTVMRDELNGLVEEFINDASLRAEIRLHPYERVNEWLTQGGFPILQPHEIASLDRAAARWASLTDTEVRKLAEKNHAGSYTYW